MSIGVVVADDHPIFRDGLVRSLEECGRFHVLGAGATAEEAAKRSTWAACVRR